MIKKECFDIEHWIEDNKCSIFEEERIMSKLQKIMLVMKKINVRMCFSSSTEQIIHLSTSKDDVSMIKKELFDIKHWIEHNKCSIFEEERIMSELQKIMLEMKRSMLESIFHHQPHKQSIS